MINKLIKHTCS